MVKIIKVKKDRNKYGELFYWVFFKDLDTGRSSKTFLCPSYDNWKRWRDVVRKAEAGEEVFLDGLLYKEKHLIDADSIFIEVPKSIVERRILWRVGNSGL